MGNIDEAIRQMDALMRKVDCAGCQRCCCEHCVENDAYFNGVYPEQLTAWGRATQELQVCRRKVHELKTRLEHCEEFIDVNPTVVKMLLDSLREMYHALNVQIEAAAQNRAAQNTEYGWNETAGFLGPQGCRLPRELRSYICLGHICLEMGNNFADGEVDRMIALTRYITETRTNIGLYPY